VFVALLLILVLPSANYLAYAMGDAPSTCPNRYDATITALTVNNGVKIYNPLSNPGVTIDADLDTGYDVTFTLHTASQSSLGNTDPGTTWYRDTAFGYGQGVCVSNVTHDQDKTISVHIGADSGFPDGYTVNGVEWGSWPNVSQVTYNVHWLKELGNNLITTTLYLNSIKSVPWSQQVTVTGKIVDANTGAGIGGRNVYFTGTGVLNIPYTTTNADGTFSASGTAPSSVATGWTVTARFDGDSHYKADDSSARTYSTLKHKTSLTLWISPDPVAKSGTYKVYGTLKDYVTSTVLSGKTITFTATPPVTISSKTTDSSGVYRATGLIAPSTTGDYQIQAHYAGDSLYLLRDSQIKTLTVQ